MSKEIVLITGGAGFIGKNLALSLLKDGIPVRILDNLSSQVHGELPKDLEWLDDGNLEFIRGSILNKELLKKSLKDVSTIFHLAAETGTGQSMYEIYKYSEVNVQATSLLLDIILKEKLNIKKIILSSSRSIYGEGVYSCKNCKGLRINPESRKAFDLSNHQWDFKCKNCNQLINPIPTKELDPINPASIYAATKLVQEDLIKITCTALDIDYAILRLQNVYGEGQSVKNPYTGIISIFSNLIKNNKSLSVFEDGNETRDFVHVKDVVDVMKLCHFSNNRISDVINVGTGSPTTILKVATLLREFMNSDVDINITGEYRLGDIRHNSADIENLKKKLFFTPNIYIEKGLELFINWVADQPLEEDRLDLANNKLKEYNLFGS